MNGYDWFIMLVAIPLTALGFIALIALGCIVIYDFWIDR